MSPDDMLNAAKAGNERFQSGKHASRDALKDQKATASGQHPQAIVLHRFKGGTRDSHGPWYRRLL
jgi:hypothetical protein